MIVCAFSRESLTKLRKGAHMKAIVQDKYGSPDDVLEPQDIDKPSAKENAVLA